MFKTDKMCFTATSVCVGCGGGPFAIKQRSGKYKVVAVAFAHTLYAVHLNTIFYSVDPQTLVVINMSMETQA